MRAIYLSPICNPHSEKRVQRGGHLFFDRHLSSAEKYGKQMLSVNNVHRRWSQGNLEEVCLPLVIPTSKILALV